MGVRWGPWLRFEVGEHEYALPLAAITEVTSASRPKLVPLLPLETAGVVNFRGEPLPVLDAGALLEASPVTGHRHMIVLDGAGLRLGLLVSQVERIEHGLSGTVDLGDGTAMALDFADWVLLDGRQLGLLRPDGLMERARALLAEQRTEGGGMPCHNAF